MSKASVSVDGEVVGQIGQGLVVFLGISGGDTERVSQFTLLADTRKGRRPSFTEAAPPEEAEALFERFLSYLRSSGLRVESGRFQQHMLVEIHNDGPVTILLDSKEKYPEP